MGPTMYLYEKAREAYYHDLRRQMEERRLLVLLPRRRSMSRRAASKLGVLLHSLPFGPSNGNASFGLPAQVESVFSGRRDQMENPRRLNESSGEEQRGVQE